MSDVRAGRIIQAVRTHRRLTQQAVADLAGIDRSVMSDLEHGRFEDVSLRTARRLCRSLQVELVVEARWRGGAVDRLLDRAHAAIVNRVVDVLTAADWVVELEVTFNEFGDRGSVDVVGWHPGRRALLVVEVKSVLTDLQAMLMSLSRKVRIVPRVLADERGWRRETLGRVLVVAGTTANRNIEATHRQLFASAFPARSREVLAWVRDPRGDLAGLWFVSPVVVRHASAVGPSPIRRRQA